MEDNNDACKQKNLNNRSYAAFFERGDVLKFRLNACEFGNTYHVAGAILCNPDQYAVNISGCSPEQKIFLKNVLQEKNIIEINESYKRDSVVSLPDSTSLIANAFEQNKQNYQTIYETFISHLIKNNKKLEEDCIKYIQDKLRVMAEDDKVIIHVRNIQDKKKDTTHRNLSPALLKIVLDVIKSKNIKNIIFIGDELDIESIKILEKYDKINYYSCNQQDKEPAFYKREDFKHLIGEDIISGQLYLYHILFKHFNTKCVIGVKSGAIDGFAFTGLPAIFFTLYDNDIIRMVNASRSICTLHPIICGKTYDNLNTSSNDKLTFIRKVVTEALCNKLDESISYINNSYFGHHNMQN
jgi:hypothetical protein